MAQGIILAAGFSSRVQTNKMLLKINGRYLIEHAILSMKPFTSHIYVVMGHYEKEIKEKIEHLEHVSFITNKHYEQGMFSSIQTGVFVMDEDFFILPGDCPFVSKKTYNALLQGTKKIRVPSYKYQRGHPIWVDKTLKEDLLKEPFTSNMKAFRNRYDFETIEGNDLHVLDDIDTLKDFQELTLED